MSGDNYTPSLNAFGVVICPDCGALKDRDNDVIKHDDNCPLGRACDEQLDDDRRWFEDHPEARRRIRPAHWSEIATQRLLGNLPPPPADVQCDVLVMEIEPGVRAKSFQCWEVIKP